MYAPKFSQDVSGIDPAELFVKLESGVIFSREVVLQPESLKTVLEKLRANDHVVADTFLKDAAHELDADTRRFSISQRLLMRERSYAGTYMQVDDPETGNPIYPEPVVISIKLSMPYDGSSDMAKAFFSQTDDIVLGGLLRENEYFAYLLSVMTPRVRRKGPLTYDLVCEVADELPYPATVLLLTLPGLARMDSSILSRLQVTKDQTEFASGYVGKLPLKDRELEVYGFYNSTRPDVYLCPAPEHLGIVGVRDPEFFADTDIHALDSPMAYFVINFPRQMVVFGSHCATIEV